MHRAVRFIDEEEGMTRTLFNGNSRSSRLVDGPLDSATAVMPVGLAYDEQTNSLYSSRRDIFPFRVSMFSRFSMRLLHPRLVKKKTLAIRKPKSDNQLQFMLTRLGCQRFDR